MYPCTWAGCVQPATTHRINWREYMVAVIETAIGKVVVDKADVRNLCDHHAHLFDVINHNRAERASQ